MNKKKVIVTSFVGLATLGLAVAGFFQRKALMKDFEELRDNIRSLLDDEELIDE